MNGEKQQWPLPKPRALPPSNPNPSQVGDGIGGLGGRDRAWEPSHGTSAGGSDRAWELSHGRHDAFMNNGTRHPVPTPRFLPPSNPNPSKVGEGLIIHGDAGGAAAGVCALPSMSLAELLEQFSRNGSGAVSSQTRAISSRIIPVKIEQPKPSNPTGQLRTALVCYY